jgi:hypothetical protein
MEITVRTSVGVRIYPADVVKTVSARTLSCIRSDAAWRPHGHKVSARTQSAVCADGLRADADAKIK